MKIKLKTLFFIYILNCIPQSFAGGGWSGGGGEFYTTEMNPWMLGDEPKSYCLAGIDGFSLSREEIVAGIQRAFEHWEYALQFLFENEPAPFPVDKGGAKKIASKFRFQDGGCDQESYIQFKFGVIDDQVHGVLSNMARHTLAFAKATHFISPTGESRGVVWLNGDQGAQRYQGPQFQDDFWQNQNTFVSVLVHEIGHTLGFQHREFGVMSFDTPYKAVKFGLEAELKPSAYHFQNWYRFPDFEFCGQAEETHSGLLALLFYDDLENQTETPLGKKLKRFKVSQVEVKGIPVKNVKVCLRRERDNGSIAKIRLRVIDDQNETIKELQLTARPLGQLPFGYEYPAHATVTGRFLISNENPNQSDYAQHHFIKFGVSQINAILENVKSSGVRSFLIKIDVREDALLFEIQDNPQYRGVDRLLTRAWFRIKEPEHRKLIKVD